MINWDNFIWFALPVLLCWAVAVSMLFILKRTTLSVVLSLAGVALFSIFVVLLWIGLDRPPMRTMGETRLWYSLFLSGIGVILFLRWKYRWMLAFSLLVASVFIIINLLKPEIHSKNLMPALQSVWFIPHVVTYILSYAFLSASTIVSVILLSKYKRLNSGDSLFQMLDNLVYIGYGLLMVGLLIGAIWAKEAWGNYWSWDPKETWAFITAAAYILYIHIRLRENKPRRITLWLLVFSFVLLLITWKGVNYLPSAKNSVHVYSNQ